MYIGNATQCREYLRRRPRAIIRTILQMRGFGFTPKTNQWFTRKKKTDLVDELVRLWSENPEKVQIAIETVISGGAPISQSALTQEIVGEVEDIKKAEEQVATRLNQIKDEAVEATAAIREQVIDDTRDHVSSVINKALEAIQASPEQLAERSMSKAMEIVDTAISKRLKQYRPIDVRVGMKRVKLRDEVFCDQFEKLLSLVANGVHTRMVGPAGCGKTHVAGQIAKALNCRAYAAVSCSMGMSESQLIGRMLPTGKGGAFEYHASPFVDIYENGGLFLLDEMDAADPNVLVTLNTALAGNQFALPQRLGNAVVERHPDFRIMAAMNTFGYGADVMYVGRNQLDEATLDRFRIGTVIMDYSDPIERTITAEASWVYNWAIDIRRRIGASGVRRIMSTRTMKDAMTMVMTSGWEQQDLEDSYFADWTQDEKLRVARSA